MKTIKYGFNKGITDLFIVYWPLLLLSVVLTVFLVFKVPAHFMLLCILIFWMAVLFIFGYKGVVYKKTKSMSRRGWFTRDVEGNMARIFGLLFLSIAIVLSLIFILIMLSLIEEKNIVKQTVTQQVILPSPTVALQSTKEPKKCIMSRNIESRENLHVYSFLFDGNSVIASSAISSYSTQTLASLLEKIFCQHIQVTGEVINLYFFAERSSSDGSLLTTREKNLSGEYYILINSAFSSAEISLINSTQNIKNITERGDILPYLINDKYCQHENECIVQKQTTDVFNKFISLPLSSGFGIPYDENLKCNIDVIRSLLLRKSCIDNYCQTEWNKVCIE